MSAGTEHNAARPPLSPPKHVIGPGPSRLQSDWRRRDWGHATLGRFCQEGTIKIALASTGARHMIGRGKGTAPRKCHSMLTVVRRVGTRGTVRWSRCYCCSLQQSAFDEYIVYCLKIVRHVAHFWTTGSRAPATTSPTLLQCWTTSSPWNNS